MINVFACCSRREKREGGLAGCFRETLDMTADKIHPVSSSQASRQLSSADKSQTGCRACWPRLLTRVYLPFALISCFAMTFLKYAHQPFIFLVRAFHLFLSAMLSLEHIGMDAYLHCTSTEYALYLYRYVSSLIPRHFLLQRERIKPSSK